MGYGDERTINRRVAAMEEWLANPQLMTADADAEYASVIEIDLNEIKEPLLACPNDPDDVKALSDVQGDQDRRSVHRFLYDQHRSLPCCG